MLGWRYPIVLILYTKALEMIDILILRLHHGELFIHLNGLTIETLLIIGKSEVIKRVGKF